MPLACVFSYAGETHFAPWFFTASKQNVELHTVTQNKLEDLKVHVTASIGELDKSMVRLPPPATVCDKCAHS